MVPYSKGYKGGLVQRVSEIARISKRSAAETVEDDCDRLLQNIISETDVYTAAIVLHEVCLSSGGRKSDQLRKLCTKIEGLVLAQATGSLQLQIHRDRDQHKANQARDLPPLDSIFSSHRLCVQT